MKALITSVDYSDLLDLTLRYNKHHFEHVTVLTSGDDRKSMSVGIANGCSVIRSDKFYENGADFNKYNAVEAAIDMMAQVHSNGDRTKLGWLCIMDADILIPQSVMFSECNYNDIPTLRFKDRMADTVILAGKLFTPLRRMFYEIRDLTYDILPPENEWHKYQIHRNVNEWAGYMHLFHSSDPVLPGSQNWYETNWRHAGGADSMFQAKWAKADKTRPTWQVLHLGGHGTNWCGRATATIDGTVPIQAGDRLARLQQYMVQRRQTRSFNSEKIGD